MSGIIKNIIESEKCATYLIWVEGCKGYARTFTGPQYRNYQYWKDLKIGDHVEGLEWKDKKRGLISGDSSVFLKS